MSVCLIIIQPFFWILEIVQAANPCAPHSSCCLCISGWSVYYLLLCSLLLQQRKFPHRGNKAELNYTELNWNKRHSTPGSLATASWCKARAGRICARTHTHAQSYTLRQKYIKTLISPLSFMRGIIFCKTTNFTSFQPSSSTHTLIGEAWECVWHVRTCMWVC